MKGTFTVHDLPLSERPRERLFKFGIEALSTQEILALILGRGIKGESVMVTAQKLITEFGNIQNIANASTAELSQINGIGPAKAAQIKAAFELGKRALSPPDKRRKSSIKTPQDVLQAIGNKLKDKKKEHFLVLSLDTRNTLIDTQIVSMGSLDSSIVHPREVFKEAISSCAASVIFVHNHPSGKTDPSKEDIEITKRLVEAGEILGIEVLDHIIVGDESLLSMKAKNLL